MPNWVPDLAADSTRHSKLPGRQLGHHENEAWAASHRHRALAALHRDPEQRDGDDLPALVHAYAIR